MKMKTLIMAGLVAILAAVSALTVQAAGPDDIDQLRALTARFHRPEAARAAKYDLVPGLDFCFENPGVGGMGYHFIKTELLDTTVDLLNPEVMVYTPGPNGILQLGAVEYVVPAAAWDATHTELPELFGQTYHLDPALGLYELHVWVWKNNPAGMFEDWNPKVSCP